MSLKVNLGFLSRTSEPPRFIVNEPGIPTTRIGAYDYREVDILNGRSPRLPLTLQDAGFALLDHPSKASFESDAAIVGTYYPEVCALTCQTLGVDLAIVMDHTVRSTQPNFAGRGAVSHIHNDYTPKSIAWHADRIVKEQGIERPHQILQVNIWRPLTEPVLHSPLALADARTIRPVDLVACPIIYPGRTGEVFELLHHPDQEWYWFPEMTCREILMFKGYDSRPKVPRYVPHMAFKHLETTAETPPRRSIEARVIAFIWT